MTEQDERDLGIERTTPVHPARAGGVQTFDSPPQGPPPPPPPPPVPPEPIE